MNRQYFPEEHQKRPLYRRKLVEITTHPLSKKVLFLAWHGAAAFDKSPMKWVFFRCSLLAKVHKSVGFGRGMSF